MFCGNYILHESEYDVHIFCVALDIIIYPAAQAAAAQAAQESAALSFEPQPQPDEEFNIQHLDDYDDESKSAVLKKEIKDFSRTNPDVVAQLIRSMMKNGE